MDGASLFTAIASPAVAFGLVKWALSKYEKQSKELELERRQHVQSEIRQIKTVTENHSTAMDALRREFSSLDKQFAVLTEKLKFNSSDVEKLLKAFHGFVESTAKRFSDLETKVTEISKDVFRVSTRKKGE